MNRILIFFAIIILGSSNQGFAQYEQNPPVKYRVVAISAADSLVESVSNELELYYPMKIYLPTAFTPNGDGLNDSFGAVGEGIEKYKLVIYNRWGEPIFSSHAVNQKWDGQHNGRPVPFGAYSYELLAYGKEFGEVHRSGQVTVLN